MKNLAPAPVAASASSARGMKKSVPSPASEPADGRSWRRSRGQRQRTKEVGAGAGGVKNRRRSRSRSKGRSRSRSRRQQIKERQQQEEITVGATDLEELLATAVVEEKRKTWRKKKRGDVSKAMEKAELKLAASAAARRKWRSRQAAVEVRKKRWSGRAEAASGVLYVPCSDDVGEERRICNKWFVGTGLT